MRERVLIVDDEEGIRTTVSGILNDEGYECEGAEDGAAAREVRLQVLL